MSYSDFDIKKVKDELQIKIVEQKGIFSKIEEVDVSDILTFVLDDNVPLALAINTEKARSELIISDVLVELRRKFDRKISLFSGVEFNVDKDKGLNGYCDFIISRSPEQLIIDSPVVIIVEAKNENIVGGIGQCIAEMVAAKIFNEMENDSIEFIYGAVTSGSAWEFLRLENDTVYIDLREYYIENVNKIVGILSAMVAQKA